MDIVVLMVKEQERLTNFAYSILRSWEDAQDVVAEMFMKALDAEADSPKAWMYQVVKHACYDIIRKQRTKHSYEERFAAEHWDLRTPEQVLDDYEQLCELLSCVEGLTPKCKLALIAVNLEGASYEEIGKLIGAKTHSVRRLVERAKTQLHHDFPFRAGPKRAVRRPPIKT